MKKAVFSILFVLVLLAVAVFTEAQQPKKIPLMGYLSPSDAAAESVRAEAIRLALRVRGYIERQNITFDEGGPKNE